MKRCPKCNSEMMIEDTHIVKCNYKVVGGVRGKNPIIEKPSENNRINSKLVCRCCKYTEEF